MSQHRPEGSDPNADDPNTSSSSTPGDPGQQPGTPQEGWPGYPGAGSSAPAPDPSQAPYGSSPYGSSYPGTPGYGDQQGYADPHAYGAGQPGYGGDAQGYGTDPQGYGTDPQGYGAYGQAPGYGDNPYGVNPYQSSYGGVSPYGVAPVPHPRATVAMILGIVGLVICPFVGIAGLVLGNSARKEIDAEPQRYTGRGMATAGFVLGILSVIYSVFIVLVVVLGLAGGMNY